MISWHLGQPSISRELPASSVARWPRLLQSNLLKRRRCCGCLHDTYAHTGVAMSARQQPTAGRQPPAAWRSGQHVIRSLAYACVCVSLGTLPLGTSEPPGCLSRSPSASTPLYTPQRAAESAPDPRKPPSSDPCALLAHRRLDRNHNDSRVAACLALLNLAWLSSPRAETNSDSVLTHTVQDQNREPTHRAPRGA